MFFQNGKIVKRASMFFSQNGKFIVGNFLRDSRWGIILSLIFFLGSNNEMRGTTTGAP
jgi:hypothetical protein